MLTACLQRPSEPRTWCDSVELDDTIRVLIERGASPAPEGAAPGATLRPRSSCSPKSPGKGASMAHAQGTTGMQAAEGPTGRTECANSSRGKSSTNSLERKIRCLEKQRKELLEVNQQWDQQFRSMKELYERKVAELKMKLETTERPLSTLEKERPPSRRDSDRPRDVAQEQQQRAQKEKESPDEELQELKRENKLLREKNAAVNRKKELYECEIKRLNKTLQDALKIEGAFFPEDSLVESEKERSLEELRTEMEVLKQQVQIYEEDFNRERSDRERLNQEKEELQQINQTCQSQLSKLKSKLKACQMEKEKLEKQLKQVYLPTCRCGFGVHLWDPCTPAGPEDAQDLERHPISPPKRKSPSKLCAQAEGCGGTGSARPGPHSSGPCGSCRLPGCLPSAPPPCSVPFNVDGGKGL
ncbi:TNFAIP3-interacting protein 3 [Desmodus rotundus]|uniref:TNFAIP3-interacting protein 3 n=1 Tax=Desmodus rotundus TaxID=9430 RepID=UPI0023815CDD|nr:TNFAIP3-interacting protein 3 [Desmodus rotundus]